MGLPQAPREWILSRRAYLDARRAELEKLPKAGRDRVLRALGFAVIRVLPAVVVGGILVLAVVVAVAAAGEHPLLVRVAQAGLA